MPEPRRRPDVRPIALRRSFKMGSQERQGRRKARRLELRRRDGCRIAKAPVLRQIPIQANLDLAFGMAAESAEKSGHPNGAVSVLGHRKVHVQHHCFSRSTAAVSERERSRADLSTQYPMAPGPMILAQREALSRLGRACRPLAAMRRS